jgi:hypothetical protein
MSTYVGVGSSPINCIDIRKRSLSFKASFFYIQV